MAGFVSWSHASNANVCRTEPGVIVIDGDEDNDNDNDNDRSEDDSDDVDAYNDLKSRDLGLENGGKKAVATN